MTKRESRETRTVTFDCPYARCDWPLCRGEDSHPLCASKEERARQSVKIKARPSILPQEEKDMKARVQELEAELHQSVR